MCGATISVSPQPLSKHLCHTTMKNNNLCSFLTSILCNAELPRGKILRNGEGLLTFLEEAVTVQRTPCIALQHQECSGFTVLLDAEQVLVMSRSDRPFLGQPQKGEERSS